MPRSIFPGSAGAPVHARPPPNRRERHSLPRGHADGPRAAQWRREKSVTPNSSRHRRVRDHLSHVSTVEEAWNAVSACRYPRLPERAALQPARHPRRRPGPRRALLGADQQEYYKRADVWPLAPDGEILVVIQCEDTRAIDNLPRILKKFAALAWC